MLSWVVLGCQGSKGAWGTREGPWDRCYDGDQVGEGPRLLQSLQVVPVTDVSVPLLLTWETRDMT